MPMELSAFQAIARTLTEHHVNYVVDINTLIEMKKAADRDKDREDIRNLEILRDET